MSLQCKGAAGSDCFLFVALHACKQDCQPFPRDIPSDYFFLGILPVPVCSIAVRMETLQKNLQRAVRRM